MSHAVVGYFNSATEASKARQNLLDAGFASSDIKLSGSVTSAAASGTTSVSTTEDKGFWSSIKELFGADDETGTDRHLNYYNEGARRGGVVLSVDASDAQADQVADLLSSAGAVDIDAKASEWQSSGFTGYQANAGAAEVTNADAANKIDLVKEDLAVGKRVVNRGGVRIVKRVIERPVEESVTLREEHVKVDRKAVDRPLHGTELNEAFKDQTFEMTESGEEAVAAKTARVVGEVVVGKTSEERVEKVRDTLRETDVQVQHLPGQVTSGTSKVVDPDASVIETSKSESVRIDMDRKGGDRPDTLRPLKTGI